MSVSAAAPGEGAGSPGRPRWPLLAFQAAAALYLGVALSPLSGRAGYLSAAFAALAVTLVAFLVRSPVTRGDTVAMLGALLLLGLAPRLSYVLTIDELPFSDMEAFETLALNILAGHGDRGHDTFYRSYYPQGTGYYVAGVYWLLGRNLLALRIVNTLLASMTTLLAYGAGRVVSGRRAGIIAAFLFAVSHEMVFWSAKLSSEHLFAWALMLALFLVARAWQRPRAVSWTLAGLGLATAFWVRPVLHLLLALVGGLILVVPRAPSARRLGWCAALLVGFGVLMAPWVVRNHRLYGAFLMSTTAGWFGALHQANDIVAPGEFGGGAAQYEAQARAVHLFANDLQAARWARHQVLSWILAHPGRYLELCVGRVKLLFYKNGIALSKVDPYVLGYWPGTRFLLVHWNYAGVPVLLPLTSVSVVLLLVRLVWWRRRDSWVTRVEVSWPLLFMGTTSGLYILVSSFPRYRDPLVPVAGVLCGVGLSEGLAVLGERWWPGWRQRLDDSRGRPGAGDTPGTPRPIR